MSTCKLNECFRLMSPVHANYLTCRPIQTPHARLQFFKIGLVIATELYNDNLQLSKITSIFGRKAYINNDRPILQ